MGLEVFVRFETFTANEYIKNFSGGQPSHLTRPIVREDFGTKVFFSTSKGTPLSSGEATNVCSCTSTPSWHGA